MEEPRAEQSKESDQQDETSKIAENARDEMDKATDDFDARLNDLSTRAETAAQKYRNQQAKVNTERKSDGESARGLGYGLTYAYVLIGTPIVGFGIGYLIDMAAGTSNYKNWFAVGGTIFGFVGMLVLISRDNQRNQK